jgi:hypothetical protein
MIPSRASQRVRLLPNKLRIRRTKRNHSVNTKKPAKTIVLDLRGEYAIHRPTRLTQNDIRQRADQIDAVFDCEWPLLETMEIILSAIYEHRHDSEFITKLLTEAFWCGHLLADDLETGRKMVHQIHRKSLKAAVRAEGQRIRQEIAARSVTKSRMRSGKASRQPIKRTAKHVATQKTAAGASA